MHTHIQNTPFANIHKDEKKKKSQVTLACDLSTWEAQNRAPSLRSSQLRSVHRETLSQKANEANKKVLDKKIKIILHKEPAIVAQ